MPRIRDRGSSPPPRALRVAAVALAAALLAIAGAAAANAATPAPATASPSTSVSSGRVVLAGGAVGSGSSPSPSPSASAPQITLGTGAPTGDGTATATPSAAPTTTSSGGGSNPSWYDIPGQVEKALTGWFTTLATDALSPALNLLGASLLSTPDVTAMPRVTALWGQMALLANALYILLILIGGAIVMSHETLQSLYSIKEIAPRLVIGLVAGNASLAVLALLIHLADALSQAILGQGVDPAQAGAALAKMVVAQIGNGGIFIALLAIGGAAMVIAVLLTWLVRLAALIILAAGAPLALACHALPHTEHIARLWWRGVTACLVTQLGQSLTFVVALKVILDPGSENSLGIPTGGGFTDILVFLALLWLLVKIPMWTGRRLLDATGGSKLIGMAKTAAAYQAFGAAKVAMGGLKTSRPKSSPPQESAPSSSYRVSQQSPYPAGAVHARTGARVITGTPVRPALASSRKGPFMADGRRRPGFQQTAIPIPGGLRAARATAAHPAPAPPTAPAPAGPGPARRPGHRQEALFPLPKPAPTGARLHAAPSAAPRRPPIAPPYRPPAEPGAAPAPITAPAALRTAPARPPAAPPAPTGPATPAKPAPAPATAARAAASKPAPSPMPPTAAGPRPALPPRPVAGAPKRRTSS